jgi:hypothetical protein
VFLGQNTENRNPLLSSKEVSELEDYWVATNREWGLWMTPQVFERQILKPRDRDPRYCLDIYLKNQLGLTRDEYLLKQGIQPVSAIAVAERYSSYCLVDVSAS